MNEQTAKGDSQPIGEDGGIVRVMNFAGGGFDTVMQLGVTHSLLVCQGKAPDVVVGVSAGAIEAAALAEVMRAGSLSAGNVSDEDYAKLLDKRVQRFRQFSDACHNAPESVVDTIIPDAYQVESFEPLASLRLPRLSKEERDERDESIKRRAGLVRLYNDLLTIDLPFGAMTRIVRRYLGMKAATAIASPIKRRAVQFLEVLRMWLVIGTELRRLTPLVPILVGPLIGRMRSQRLSTAGSIIFKFRPVEHLMNFLKGFWSFLFLVSFWVVVSLIVASLPLLPALIYDARHPGSDTPIYLYLFVALYAVPMILPLMPFAVAYDKTARWASSLTLVQ